MDFKYVMYNIKCTEKIDHFPVAIFVYFSEKIVVSCVTKLLMKAVSNLTITRQLRCHRKSRVNPY